MECIKPTFHCDAKTFALGPGVGLDPQRQNFASGIPTCWYLKMRNPRRQTLIFALPPMPTPDASQWNIGGVGSPTQNIRVGHVHFMLFMSISLASGTQRKHSFQWNMGLRKPYLNLLHHSPLERHFFMAQLPAYKRNGPNRA